PEGIDEAYPLGIVLCKIQQVEPLLPYLAYPVKELAVSRCLAGGMDQHGSVFAFAAVLLVVTCHKARGDADIEETQRGDERRRHVDCLIDRDDIGRRNHPYEVRLLLEKYLASDIITAWRQEFHESRREHVDD